MPAVKQIPEELAKRGITRLTDNRQGQQVRLAPGLVVSLFGDELRAHFARHDSGGPDGRPAVRPGGA